MSLDAKISLQDDTLLLKVKYVGQPVINFKALFSNVKIYGVKNMSIQAGQKVGLSIHPTDAFGNVARLDGKPVWASSDEEVITLTVSEDGLQVTAQSVGPVGTAIISVTADSDLNQETVHALRGEVAIEVEAGEAVDLNAHIDPIVVQLAPVSAPAVVEAPVVEEVAAESVVEEVAAAEVIEEVVAETTEEAPAEEVAAESVVEEAPAAESSSDAADDTSVA